MKDCILPIVVVCFGTPSVSGDALGPRIGTLLREKYNTPAFVYGTSDQPVHGRNMPEWMSFISEVHKGAIVIAVDASLGERAKAGRVILRADGVCPAAVKGAKRRFGDIGLLGVVGENRGDALMELMQVSAVYVEKLAHKMAFMLNAALSDSE